ncbi:hypothetical protein TWF102_000627 [Orbilia oligospora]|uniref:Uncharacterized protein n=1 Tax=Orbilia oligospora TaxID=2813651 RepID=A0A7C8JID9_ORBOL|nr:hypothetical protein TWF102_000627 [Orbilia oligospora]KAF3099423.1 hypothetical protein TWF706_006523 [Orbilia oligospora]KAF3120163.1 hypothetical protein TWF703_002710 [Orbilia oligospora]
MQPGTLDLLQFGIDPDTTSTIVDTSSIDTHGFGEGYILRKHNSYDETDRGTEECRNDWKTYVGPVRVWGNRSDTVGNLMSLGMPMAIPERLALCAYISESYEKGEFDVTDAFLSDNMMEQNQNADLDIHTNNLCINSADSRATQSIAGAKQLQSKILLELLETDLDCGRQLVEQWQEMVSTTITHSKNFNNLDEYLEFRILDTGCGFSGGVILFGMGIRLTDEEHKIAREVVIAVWRALALLNDYFSFNKEYREFLESDDTTLVNAVWLYMQWGNLDIETAKDIVRKKALEFEQKFLKDRQEFLKTHAHRNTRLAKYIEGWYYAMSANLWWNLDCPRYHSAPPNPEPTDPSVKEIEERLGNTSIEGQNVTHQDLATSSTSDKAASHQKNELETPTAAASLSLSKATNETAKSSNEVLDTKLLLEPYEYLISMPSKGVREAFVDALNLWFSIPEPHLTKIKDIGKKLHTASILLDDIEDNSPLRRGQKAAHVVYGEGQAINSANYLIIWAMDETRRLGNSIFSEIFFEESRNALIGQSYEMHWRDTRKCPTEDEYIEMVEKKTGGLFRFLTRVMTAFTENSVCANLNLDNLAYMVGQYFQIRDDFMNLTNTDYTGLKGFCEDLDEGKFSYLVVHSWNVQSAESSRLRTLFEERYKTGLMAREAKEEVLGILQRNGSFDYTEKKMKQLAQGIDDEVSRLEEITGEKNWSLRLLIHKLTAKS